MPSIPRLSERGLPPVADDLPTNEELETPQSWTPKTINVSDWFDEQQREVCLELEGVRYRLRLTRRNKLILQK